MHITGSGDIEINTRGHVLKACERSEPLSSKESYQF